MKYVATVRKVSVRGVHRLSTNENGEVRSIADLPDPDRIEIELDGSEAEPCMMYRYAADGQCCGDTWHQSFEQALEQAKYEYELDRSDFSPV